jgi:hypothetical protein
MTKDHSVSALCFKARANRSRSFLWAWFRQNKSHSVRPWQVAGLLRIGEQPERREHYQQQNKNECAELQLLPGAFRSAPSCDASDAFYRPSAHPDKLRDIIIASFLLAPSKNVDVPRSLDIRGVCQDPDKDSMFQSGPYPKAKRCRLD